MIKNGIGNLMKQAQKMQDDLKVAQEKLAQEEVIGESGGGMIKITMNGKHEVKRVRIDNNLFSEDKDMLEDLIASACNDAIRRVSEKMEQSMSGLTSGLHLPPGFKI